jgi:hypothetical protein
MEAEIDQCIKDFEGSIEGVRKNLAKLTEKVKEALKFNQDVA